MEEMQLHPIALELNLVSHKVLADGKEQRPSCDVLSAYGSPPRVCVEVVVHQH